MITNKHTDHNKKIITRYLPFTNSNANIVLEIKAVHESLYKEKQITKNNTRELDKLITFKYEETDKFQFSSTNKTCLFEFLQNFINRIFILKKINSNLTKLFAIRIDRINYYVYTENLNYFDKIDKAIIIFSLSSIPLWRKLGYTLYYSEPLQVFTSRTGSLNFINLIIKNCNPKFIKFPLICVNSIREIKYFIPEFQKNQIECIECSFYLGTDNEDLTSLIMKVNDNLKDSTLNHLKVLYIEFVYCKNNNLKNSISDELNEMILFRDDLENRSNKYYEIIIRLSLADGGMIYNTVEKKLVRKNWKFEIISIKYSSSSFVKKMKKLYIWQTILKYLDNYLDNYIYNDVIDTSKISIFSIV